MGHRRVQVYLGNMYPNPIDSTSLYRRYRPLTAAGTYQHDRGSDCADNSVNSMPGTKAPESNLVPHVAAAGALSPLELQEHSGAKIKTLALSVARFFCSPKRITPRYIYWYMYWYTYWFWYIYWYWYIPIQSPQLYRLHDVIGGGHLPACRWRRRCRRWYQPACQASASEDRT